MRWPSSTPAGGTGRPSGWRESALADAPVDPFRKRQLWLSAVFVLGCGFRSLIPRADVQRFGLIDSWLSSALIGRSVATAAELCFVAQGASLACRRPGRRVPVRGRRRMASRPTHRRGRGVLVDRSSDHLLLGQRGRGIALALAASLLVASGLIVWARCRPVREPFLTAALALGILYILFMVSVDIPMYFARWQADEASGKAYLALGQGLRDAWRAGTSLSPGSSGGRRSHG